MNPISKRFGLCLVLVALILPSVSAQVIAVINPSKTNCVAPCAVFFDGISTTGLTDGDYVNAYFSWDFDSTDVDPAGQDETATGFLGSYVFNEPGTYVVVMNVSDKDGNTGTANVTVDVLAFSGTTYYVADDGSDSNSGITMDEPLETVNYAIGQAGPNTQILFKRGDSWDFSWVNIDNRAGPVIIGAYTDPSDPSNERPILHSTSTSGASFLIRNSQDWRFIDLHLIGNGMAESATMFDAAGSSVSHLLLYNIEIEQIHNMPIYMMYVDGFFIFNSSIYNVWSYGIYGGTNRFAFVNNDVNGSMRIASGQKTLIRKNKLARSETSTYCISLRGRGLEGQINRDVVISENELVSNIGTHGSGEGVLEWADHILVEKNFFNPMYGAIGFAIPGGTDDMVIRNNLFYNVSWAMMDGASGPYDNDNISVYHNTQYTPSDSSHVFLDIGGEGIVCKNNIMYSLGTDWGPFIRFRGDVNDLDSDNNLYYRPNQYSHWLPFELNGVGMTIDEWRALGLGNDTLDNTDPEFLSTTYGDVDFLKIDDTSLAYNAGVDVPVWEDYDGVSRPRGLGWDIGAYEWQGGTGGCTNDAQCNDFNPCTGDKCEYGSCRYINYNLDGSDTIGLGDIIQIIAYWGGSNPGVDLDGNGNVGLADIILLIGVWGEFC